VQKTNQQAAGMNKGKYEKQRAKGQQWDPEGKIAGTGGGGKRTTKNPGGKRVGGERCRLPNKQRKRKNIITAINKTTLNGRGGFG